MRGGLARGGGPGHDQPAAGADLPLVQQRQQPALPVISRMVEVVDHDKLGVVADAGLVVGAPLLLAVRAGPCLVGQQVEVGRVGVDEPPPALQVVVGSGRWRAQLPERGHRLPPFLGLLAGVEDRQRDRRRPAGPSRLATRLVSGASSGSRPGGRGRGSRPGPGGGRGGPWCGRRPGGLPRRACGLDGWLAGAVVRRGRAELHGPRRSRLRWPDRRRVRRAAARAWSQASSPNGTGAVRRCFQGTVIQPPSRWLRTQTRDMS